MIESVSFSVVNVSVGFVVSWLLSMYVLPVMMGVKRNRRTATAVTVVYTAAAIIRNIVIFEVWK